MKQFKAVIAIFVLGLLSLLPLRWAQAVGRWIGRRASANPQGELCRVTRINLEACFPGMSDSERQQLAKESLLQTGMSISEMGMSWLWSPSRTLKKVTQVNNEQLITESVALGKGCILIAPHLGNWEVLNLYLSAKYPFTAMYKPPKLKMLDDLIKKMRARLGTRMAPADASGVRMVMKALKRGEMVGILPDQEPESGGTFSTFYGQDIYSMKLLAQLVKQTGARVVCGFAERLENGRGFEIHFLEPNESIYDRDLQTAVNGMNRSVMNCVDQKPTQYQWEYKLFDHRPEGQPSLYRKR